MSGMKKNKSMSLCLFAVLGASFLGCTSKIAPPPPPKESSLSDIDRASANLKKAPTYENYLQYGLQQLNHADPGGAERSFEKATRLSSGSAVAWNNLCAARNGLHHWATAIEACQKAAEIDTTMVLAKNNLAYAVDSQKKSSEQIAALEKKALSTHSEPGVVLELGLLYYNRGEYPQAITVWRKIERTSKIWPTAQSNIGSASILSGDFSSAKLAIDEAIAAEPTNPLFKNNQKWLLQAQKDREETPR
jgi:tetratricopeptide (TPR) repeat protein